MILYLIQSTTALLLCFALYQWLLKGTKMFRFNRFYLMACLLFSLLCPALQIQFDLSEVLPNIQKEQVKQYAEWTKPLFSQELRIVSKPSSLIPWGNFFIGLYLAVALGLLIRFALHLLLLLRLSRRKGPMIHGIQFILVASESRPFSFFNKLYVYEEQLEEILMNESILKHEQAHIAQGHSFDVLLIEFLHCLFWFNPLVWMYKKSIKANHEFLADEYGSQSGSNKSEYLLSLLAFAEKRKTNPLSSGFGYHVIKKRIQMIQTNKPNSMKKTLRVSFSLLMTIGFISLSAFQPMPHKSKQVISNVMGSEISENKPSILPISEAKIQKIASHYGMRYNPITEKNKMHTGIDFKAPEGTAILATADGKIELAEYSSGYGNHIKIKHDETYGSMYAHLSSLKVKPGQEVKKGETIGIIGSSGKSLSIHLHYEVLKDSKKVDPALYFPIQLEKK